MAGFARGASLRRLVSPRVRQLLFVGLALQLTSGIRTPGRFWFYAGFGLVALAVFALRVPETRDRSLEDIERQLGSGRRERAKSA